MSDFVLPFPNGLKQPARPEAVEWDDWGGSEQADRDADRVTMEWLEKNAPESAREQRIEERHLRDQRLREVGPPSEMLADGAQAEIFETVHWAESVFPGCGLREMASITKPYLTEHEHLLFCLLVVEAQTMTEAARQLKIGRNTASKSLESVRFKLEASLPQIRLSHPDIYFPEPSSETLMSATNIYRARPPRSPVKALVCDCGHHLTWADKRRDYDKTKVNWDDVPYVCGHCHKVWPKGTWEELER